jgi:hypothetical protein
MGFVRGSLASTASDLPVSQKSGVGGVPRRPRQGAKSVTAWRGCAQRQGAAGARAAGRGAGGGGAGGRPQTPTPPHPTPCCARPRPCCGCRAVFPCGPPSHLWRQRFERALDRCFSITLGHGHGAYVLSVEAGSLLISQSGAHENAVRSVVVSSFRRTSAGPRAKADMTDTGEAGLSSTTLCPIRGS